MPTTKRPKGNDQTDEWVKTDEWGLYDPARAGIPALFARLGKPIVHQAADDGRRKKRRVFRVERSGDGVCMAIDEARRRAFPDPEPTAGPAVHVAPEPKVRKATRRPRKSAAAAAPVETAAPRRSMRAALLDAAAKSAALAAATAAAPSAPAAPAEPAEPDAARGARTTKRSTGSTRAAGTAKTRRTKKAPTATAASSAVPPPSPRRPRGPVPLAAWAHAVTDTPPAPRRDPMGLWRSVFRIPSDIALVEYARGCRIHRLVIETAVDAPDFY